MLPFGFTYRLLSFVQKLLEQMMFYWAEAWLPDLLDRTGWESPEEGELNMYKYHPSVHLLELITI